MNLLTYISLFHFHSIKTFILFLTFVSLLRINFESMSRKMYPVGMPVHPSKTQISLRVHAVWSESSIDSLWLTKGQTFIQAEN